MAASLSKSVCSEGVRCVVVAVKERKMPYVDQSNIDETPLNAMWFADVISVTLVLKRNPLRLGRTVVRGRSNIMHGSI